MKKRSLLIILFLAVLIYPLYSIFQLEQVLEVADNAQEAESKLVNYQVSVWISWIVLIAAAVYFKWSRKKNFFFYLTYAFLFVAFGIYGMYHQIIVNTFDVPTPFSDNYTLGIFTAVQNIFVSVILTGFLQAAVWWFTRRWHRR